MKVLVCGSRGYNDAATIRHHLSQLPPGTIIIHGGAKGADTMAGDIAAELRFPVVTYPAEWDVYGRSAGARRNQYMLDEGKPDMVLAFWDGHSKGTSDMLNRAKKTHVPCRMVDDKAGVRLDTCWPDRKETQG